MTSRNKKRTKLDKINDKENERLGSKAITNTRAFYQKQSFGAASSVRKIDPKTYKPT